MNALPTVSTVITYSLRPSGCTCAHPRLNRQQSGLESIRRSRMQNWLNSIRQLCIVRHSKSARSVMQTMLGWSNGNCDIATVLHRPVSSRTRTTLQDHLPQSTSSGSMAPRTVAQWFGCFAFAVYLRLQMFMAGEETRSILSAAANASSQGLPVTRLLNPRSPASYCFLIFHTSVTQVGGP